MIIEDIKAIKTGKRELKEFGITMGIILGLLGVLFLWQGRGYYFYFLIISAMFIFLGSVLYTLLTPIYKVWMILTTLLGWFMTRVILCILFFLILTPIGLAARLFGKDFLGLNIGRNNVNSYWIPKKASEFKRENYERRF